MPSTLGKRLSIASASSALYAVRTLSRAVSITSLRVEIEPGYCLSMTRKQGRTIPDFLDASHLPEQGFRLAFAHPRGCPGKRIQYGGGRLGSRNTVVARRISPTDPKLASV